MPPKRRIDPRTLYVSRDRIETSNGENIDPPSENQNIVVSTNNTHASTSHAHVDPLYDAANIAYFSSDESAHGDDINNEEPDNLCADEIRTSDLTDTRIPKKGRRETTCRHIHLMSPDKVIKMQRNDFGQFVGDGQVQLSSFMGTLIRTRSLLPMTPLSWTHVSNFNSIEVVIARGGPKSMPVSEFVDMVTYWYSTKGKSISEKNKTCRSNQIGAHALGRTSLANRRKELAIELGKEPTRLEFYINSRTSKAKDNSSVDDYAISKKDVLEKAIAEQMSQCPLDTPIGEIHEAAFRSTFGTEYYGRCRSMGSGVTSIQVYPDLSRRPKMSGTTNSKEMREIDQLKLQMMNMQKTINCLVNVMSQQGSREDCSGTSAAPGVFLSTDQLARMINNISRPNQSTESTPNDTPPTEPNTRIHHEQGGHGEN